MPRFRVFVSKLAAQFRRRSHDSDFEEEMRQHLSLLAERFIGQGMTAQEAASAARRQFGNAGLLEEERRELRSFFPLESLWRDLRYGARQLRSNALFTTIAVLALALGIGANTAVFSLLDQLVLRLLPVRQPERLVMIWSTGPPLGNEDGERASSYPMYQDFAREAKAFDFVFCRSNQQVAVGSGGRTERADAELVSGNYFEALGAGPELGRVFSPGADDRVYEGHPVVVLSHRYWVNRFGGDPKVVGTKIAVNNYPMQIVGVSAAGFAGLDPSRSPDVWLPIQMKPLMTPGQDDLGNRRSNWIQIFARLKPGYTAASARASLQPLFHQILVREAASDPNLREVSPYDRARFLKRAVIVETAASGYSEMREQYSTALIVLMSMASLILLIACANVASLLIARSEARRREMAVRLAIGAGRKTLVRQLLVESLLLAIPGAAAGIGLSILTGRVLLSMLPGSGAMLILRAEPDLRVLLFRMGVAISTAMLFGLAPALHGTRLDVATTLKMAGGAVTAHARSAALRKALVTAQVALSLLLLIGAGLFARTLSNLKNTRSGFERIGDLVSFEVDPAKLGYSVPRIREFYENLTREIQSTPGVTSVGYAVVPVFQSNYWAWGIAVEGHRATDGESAQSHANVISPGYFRTLGVPLLAGRDFDGRDRFNGAAAAQMPDVAIVNRKFAEHYFGDRSPIGRHIGNAGNNSRDAKLTARIIGEVENSLYEGPREGVPREVFYAQAEAPVPLRACFYVRASRSPGSIFPALRQIVARLDSSIPVDDMKTLETQLDDALSTERLIAFLSQAFGGLATVLAALGLYGIVAFLVAQRTKEIGVRMALGAGQISVVWLIVRELVRLLGTGVAIGVPCALLLSRYVSSQLFGVTPADALTWIAALSILGISAAVSALVPARRASAIDPVKALRFE